LCRRALQRSQCDHGGRLHTEQSKESSAPSVSDKRQRFKRMAKTLPGCQVRAAKSTGSMLWIKEAHSVCATVEEGTNDRLWIPSTSSARVRQLPRTAATIRDSCDLNCRSLRCRGVDCLYERFAFLCLTMNARATFLGTSIAARIGRRRLTGRTDNKAFVTTESAGVFTPSASIRVCWLTRVLEST
jgi:hypothetical protein